MEMTYGVFVRFRRSRLPLRRKIAGLDEAFAIADALRAERLHGREEVFVARETDGAVMLSPAASGSAPGARPGERASHAASHAVSAALDRARTAEARAAAAERRLAIVVHAVDAIVARGGAPPALVRAHERARFARDLYGRAVASFGRALAIVTARHGAGGAGPMPSDTRTARPEEV